MTLGIPQLIFLALIVLNLGIVMAKNGQPRSGKHSFVANLIADGLLLGLLYWGGFFC
jgi:hypothetical protein